MKPNKRGFYSEDTVLRSGLHIVDFEADVDCYCEISWFSYSDMKKILRIHLTAEEREDCIAAFIKMKNGHGYIPLYSFIDILTRRADQSN